MDAATVSGGVDVGESKKGRGRPPGDIAKGGFVRRGMLVDPDQIEVLKLLAKSEKKTTYMLLAEILAEGIAKREDSVSAITRRYLPTDPT